MNETYQFAKGDYIELVHTTDPHTRLKPGDRGTNSEIVDTKRAGLPRTVRELTKKQVHTSHVTVVTLRRAVHAILDHDLVTRKIDWSWRWLVQGHHRHVEAYAGSRHHATPLPAIRDRCAICDAKITWVRGYVKGPDDKPLKASEGVVYRLSR